MTGNVTSLSGDITGFINRVNVLKNLDPTLNTDHGNVIEVIPTSAAYPILQLTSLFWPVGRTLPETDVDEGPQL